MRQLLLTLVVVCATLHVPTGIAQSQRNPERPGWYSAVDLGSRFPLGRAQITRSPHRTLFDLLPCPVQFAVRVVTFTMVGVTVGAIVYWLTLPKYSDLGTPRGLRRGSNLAAAGAIGFGVYGIFYAIDHRCRDES